MHIYVNVLRKNTFRRITENRKYGFLKGWFCKYGDGDAEKTQALFIADIDENGNFVNIEELEDPR